VRRERSASAPGCRSHWLLQCALCHSQGGDESAREAIRSARRQRREAKELAEAREEEATDEEEQVESISIWG